MAGENTRSEGDQVIIYDEGEEWNIDAFHLAFLLSEDDSVTETTEES